MSNYLARRALGVFIFSWALIDIGAAQSVGTALVNNAPIIQGTIDGNLQQMIGATVSLNGSGTITGDLLVPGTPTLVLNGGPTFGGTIVGSGSTSPSNYQVILNGGGVRLGHLRTRTNPSTIPGVSAPPTPAGTRSVTITAAGQSAGAFATLRNLTLNGNVGQYSIPAGTYGDFTANAASGFTLGTAGAQQAAVYNFQHLTFNGAAQLRVLGPVIVTVANGFIGNGSLGSSTNSSWLTLKISSGSFTVNGSCSVYGFVFAPSGTVTINGSSQLIGGSVSDRLTVNTGGLLRVQTFVPPNSAPVANNQTVNLNEDATANITLTGSDPDGTPITYIIVTQPAHGALTGTAPNLTYTPAANYNGTDSFTFKVNDGQLNSATATVSINIAPVNDPPVVALTAPANNAVFVAPANITVSANASDIDNAITKVEFFAGSTKIGQATATPYQIQWSNVAAGSYVLTAKATDASGATATSAPRNITVEPPNQAPVANNQTVNLNEDATANITLTGSDPDGNPITYIIVTQPAHGALTGAAPNLIYTPAANYNGTDSFTFRVNDGQLNSATATVSINIAPVNDPPVVALTAPANNAVFVAPASITVSANASDIDNAITKVEFFAGSTKIGQATATPYQILWSDVAAGSYVLTAKATDASGATATSAPRNITVEPPNQAPVVNAGADQTIRLPAAAALAGSATDDGRPTGSSLSYLWSKVSGPGNVTFDSATSPATGAHFSIDGTYLLHLAVSDSQLTGGDDVRIVVQPANQAPHVNAGPDQTIALPNTVVVSGTATDDGLPTGSSLSYAWSKVSGPGTVTFQAPTAASSRAGFSHDGVYVLRLTVSDSELSGTDDVTVTVDPKNDPPMVNAGPDQSITLPNGATLDGTVTDDGNPAGGTLSIDWNKVSGPGTVTFSNKTSADTSATFSAAGTYTLRLSASDSQLARTDDVVITVSPHNDPPTVDAGADTSTELPDALQLNGTVTDDGNPANGTLTISWTKVSGPGNATFAIPAQAATAVTFSEVGSYVLRLTGNDSQLSASDDILVDVTPRSNRAPQVNAGPDQTLNLYNVAALNGQVTDDGLPNGTVTTSWSKVSGPGAVTFSEASAAATSATFSATGVYVLRLTANDSALSAYDEVTIHAEFQNQAPVVDAGPDKTADVQTPIALAGDVSDDGVPSGATLTITWSKINGPGSATFSDASSTATSVTFSDPGTYVLQLSANDSELEGTDQMTVQVAIGCTAPPSGLVGLWRGDNDASDSVGSNDAILNGATFAPGLVNAAFALNGTNSVKVPHASSINVGAGAGLTVELWTNPSTLNQQAPLIEWNNGAIGVHLWFSYPGQAQLYGNIVDSNGGNHTFNTDSVMTAGNFQHVAITYDKATGLAVIYRDGQVVAQQNLGSFTPQTSFDLFFGQRGGYLYSGLIDEVSLYERALSAAEIQAIYNAGASGKCAGPINHRPMVNAGPEQTIPFGYALNLQGSVTDDGLPLGSSLFSSWSVVSGPGAAAFVDASSLTTPVNFDTAGTYVLRLTGSDGDLEATSEVTITVLAADQTVPDTVVITPYQATDWRFKVYPYGTVPENVGAIDFDDSDYSANGRAAFGSGGGCPIQSTVHTQWPINTELVLRRVVDLPPNVTNVRVSGTVDNDVRVLINGADASGGFVSHENCAQLDDTRINVVTTSLQPGANLFVVHARDRGFESYVDVRLLIDQPIHADAGPDATVAGGDSVLLDGSQSTAFSGSPLTYQWTQISGPAVSLDLGNPAHPHFIAPSLSATTVLIFRLFVNDGHITSNPDTVAITVTPAGVPNEAPMVDAGADQTLATSTVNLQGSVQDDGLPAGSTISARWSAVSGPGTVSFADASAPITSANFSRPGSYVLRLTANDSQLQASDDVAINVPANVNLAPSINAGADQTINFSEVAHLAAQVSDDGLPNGTLSVRWTQVSGPGQAFFANPYAAATNASFSAAGIYTLRVSASDSALTSTDDIQVTVVPPGNQPPTADAGPDQTISVHSSATLNGAGDDDGLPDGVLYFQWSVLSGPGSVNFTNTNGVLSASFSTPGIYVLRFLVSDTELSATDDIVITVYGDNQAPVVSAGGNQSIRSGNSASLNGAVTDDGLPIGGSLTVQWSKVSGPGNVTFGNANAAATSASFDQAGTYVLRLSASDGELSASSTTTVTVTSAANIPPSVSISSPANGSNALAGHPVTISASASDSDGTVTKVEFYVNGSKIGEKTSSPFNFVWSGGAVGTYSLTAVATDNENASTTSAAVTLHVVDESNTQPVVDLVSPAEGDTLTAPTPVIGTVDTPILQSYMLQYRLKDQVCAQWVTFATGYTNVVNANLGTLDTTLLRNGIYEIRLLVTDLNGAMYVLNNNVIVDGNMKVGNFTVAFNDLQLPLGGIPITVTRTYDSRDVCSGDFGFGWNLDVDSVRLQKNFALGDKWFADVQPPPDGNPFVIPVYSILDDGPHVITISFPDGKTYRFRPILRLRATGEPLVRPFYPYTTNDAIMMKFEALPGTQGQLIGRGVPESLYMEDGTYQAPTRFLSVPQDFETEFVDATGFDFVTQDGRTFTFNAQGKLTKMADRNGNTLTFDHNGIFHSSGKSIQFVRDGDDRIKQIVDPNGNALNYQYDAHGDLLAFFDRTADPVNGPATATFAYQPGNHYLTGIFDSRGIQGIRNFYDADGRLYETDDADGNQTIITHDLGGRQEMIRDRNGNTTTHHYDERGNITLTINAKGEQTATSYHTWSDGTKSDLKEIETVTGLFSDGNGGLTTKSLTTHYFYEEDGTSQPLNDGLLRKVVDPLGHATTFTYNATGQVLTMTDARANAGGGSQPSVTNTYFANGNLHESFDALGNVTTYGYDAHGNRASETRQVTVVDAQGGSSTQTLVTLTDYTASGFLQKTTDATGHITTFVPDANNNVLSETTTRTNASGATVTMVTEHEYDEQDRLIRTWNAENPRASATAPSSETVFNTLGKPEYVYDALRHPTHNEYDSRGYLSKVTYPDGNFEETLYDKEGRREFFTDRGGRKTRYHYDVVGRLDETIFLGAGSNPPVTLSMSIFDAAGRVCTTTDANGNPTTSIYDDAGRRVGMLNAKSELSRYGYDANGNQTSFTDALNRIVQYGYDALNRRTSTLLPLSEVDVNGSLTTTATESVTTYDELGRRVVEYEQSPAGTSLGQRRSKRFVYDALGRLADVVDAAGQITHYSYDELGNQLTQRDAKQHTTSYGYDNLGRRLTRALPLGQSELNTFDAAGNLRFKRDFNGATTEYQYDPLNRLLHKIPDPALGNATVSFSYTSTGKRGSMNDASGATVYHYTERDQLQDKITPVGTLTYSYYPTGTLATMQSSNVNGVAVEYRYDALNRLEHAIDQSAGATDYVYDGVGNLDHFTYPNGVQHAYGYDTLNRLKGLGVYNTAQPGTPLSAYTYTVAPVGQRTSVHENTGRNVGYTYDNLHRLTREAIANAPLGGINGVIDYVYDQVGNRQSRTSSVTGIANQTFGYDANDRLTSDIYDNNGNTTLGHLDGIVQPVIDSYDYENHLTQRTGGTGSNVTLAYDGDGNKVRETANGQTITYLIDNQNPTGYAQVVEELVNGSVFRRYTFGHDLLSENQLIASVWSPSFYGYDGHGSVRLLTNSAGLVTDTYTYDAFGQLIQSSGSTPNDYRYSGEQLDSNLGLYYLRARYLNAANGRFWTMDSWDGASVEPKSLHKFMYANCDPANERDSSGHIVDSTDFLIDGIIVHRNIGYHFMAEKPPGRRLANYVPLSGVINREEQRSPEERLLTNEGLGFLGLKPDLVDLDSKEVWEIKTTRGYLEGRAALLIYLGILNGFRDQTTPPWVVGTSYSPPAEVGGFFRRANVYPPLNGVILYDPFISNQAVAEGVALAASTPIIAGIGARAAQAAFAALETRLGQVAYQGGL
jgi:RHS repeat-associated protein